MCKQCQFISDIFAAAEANPHSNYLPVLKALHEFSQQGRIELFAGDCDPSDAADHLYREDHYTICHYYRCPDCGRLFFIGACIRGIPLFKEVNQQEEEEKIENLLWGRLGSFFQRKTP